MATVSVAACEKTPAGPDPVPPPPVPKVSGVSATTVAPGDSIIIDGTNFLIPASRNTVIFANSVAKSKPYAATTTELRVIVSRHAADGPVRVTVDGQPSAGVGPAITVTRGVGDGWVFAGSNLTLAGAAAQYLVIAHAANPSRPYTEIYPYTISTNAVALSHAAIPGGVGAPGDMTIREEFELHRAEETERLLRHARWGEAEAERSQAGLAAAVTRQFFVLKTTSGSTASPSSFANITAELRATGARCLVYSDVDTLAAGNFSQANFDNFAAVFDAQFSPTNRAQFGVESDVDANGKVLIVITPVVNRLTPPNSSGFIGGFFLSNDLLAPGNGTPAGTTNHAEVFYALAADPNGTFVQGNLFPVAFAAQEDLKTIAHEYEHLISFATRVFQYGGVTQVTWLEEGMAHMAEELNGMNSSNVLRANRYLARPDTMTLEHNTAPLAQRGAAYLFLRYLGDRFGDSIYGEIVNSPCVGRACVEAITGEDFYLTVADFLATLYLSGRGITSDPRYNYQSIDLGAFDSVAISNRVVGGPAVAATTMRSTGGFYIFTSAVLPGQFAFTASSNARLRAFVMRVQ